MPGKVCCAEPARKSRGAAALARKRRPHPDHARRQSGPAAALQEFLAAQRDGRPYDEAAFEACLHDSVAEVVRKQAEIGLDIVNDGEYGKTISWSRYVLQRLSGFEQRGHARPACRRPSSGATAANSRNSTPTMTAAKASAA